MSMFRAYIDQPSTLQPLHDMHGTNVLVDKDSRKSNGGESYTVYLLEGPVISMMVPPICLSAGWLPVRPVQLFINPVNPLLSEHHQTYARGYKAGLEEARQEIIKAGYPVEVTSK